MSTSEVTVYNWTISAVGSAARVQATTEASREAAECRLWYDSVRDQILRSAPWDCARAYKRLALSAERETGTGAWVNADPAPGWRYAYSLPADLLAPRYLSTYAMFELGTNSMNQKVLYTNEVAAVLCYTKLQSNVEVWDADLIAAVGFGLAAHIAMQLTGSVEKVRLVTAQAMDKILTARQTAANVPQFMQESAPEWIVGRGYALASSSPQFIHPYSNFTVTGVTSGLT